MFPWYTKYPYQNDEVLNLDWILKTIENLVNEVTNFVTLNTIKYADPIQWNITSQYEKNTVVVDPITGTAYLSSKPVPAGVGLDNEDYWTVIFTLDIISANNNITLRNDANNILATFESEEDDWLITQGILYVVTRHIDIGQQYIAGYNLDRATVESFLKLYISNLKSYVDTLAGDLDNLSTTDKNNLVAAINELVTTCSNIVTTIGDLDDLDTTDKTSVVNAINEVLDTAVDLKKEMIKVVNVKELGLDNTGATDNSSKLAAILNDVEAGSTIYFEQGTYKFTSKITIESKQLNIIGDGIDSVLIFDDDGIEIKADKCLVKDLLLLPNSTTKTGLYVSGDFCRVDNIFLRDSVDGSKYWVNSIHLVDPWYTVVSNCQINDFKASSNRNGTGIRCTACVNVILENIFIGFKNFGIVCPTTEVNGHKCDGIQIEAANIVTCNQGVNISGGSNFIFNNVLLDQIYNFCYNLSNMGYMYVHDSYIAILSARGTTITGNERLVTASGCNHIEFDNCSFRGRVEMNLGIAFYNSDDVAINGGDVLNLADAVVFNTSDASAKCKFANIDFDNITGKTFNISKCDLICTNNFGITSTSLFGTYTTPVQRVHYINHVENIEDVAVNYYNVTINTGLGRTPKTALCQLGSSNAFLEVKIYSLSSNSVTVQLYSNNAIGTLGNVTFRLVLFE